MSESPAASPPVAPAQSAWQQNFIPPIVVPALMAVVVIGLGLYRL